MALIVRLKSIGLMDKCLKFGLVSTSRTPCSCPTNLQRAYFHKLFSKPTQRKLKIADDIPDSLEMIYRNTMSKYILGAQITTIICGGLVFIAFLFKPEYKNYQEFQEWSPTAKTIENEEFLYIAFFVTFFVLMQVMISRTPIRIYKVPQSSKYISINYGNYFFGKDRFTFKRGEIFHMEETGILPWKGNRYLIQSETDRRTIILIDHYFRRPADLSIMLGEQKDPDIDN